jgi:hypothetical protein
VLRDHIALVSRAAKFAAQRHSGQHRKGSAREPYVNHVAEVAALLAETTEEPNAKLVAAGWLHDTVEDTATKHEEIETLFGHFVADLVAAVTDDKSLPKAKRKRLQVQNAPHKSPDAKALTIADKISNVRSLLMSPPDDWELARLTEYIDWAECVVAGCRGVNSKLDDIFDATIAQAREGIGVSPLTSTTSQEANADREPYQRAPSPTGELALVPSSAMRLKDWSERPVTAIGKEECLLEEMKVARGRTDADKPID